MNRGFLSLRAPGEASTNSAGSNFGKRSVLYFVTKNSSSSTFSLTIGLRQKRVGPSVTFPSILWTQRDERGRAWVTIPQLLEGVDSFAKPPLATQLTFKWVTTFRLCSPIRFWSSSSVSQVTKPNGVQPPRGAWLPLSIEH